MKTPRELLLARQRSIQPKLDAIRAQVICELRVGGEHPRIAPAKTSLWLRIWQEVVLPARVVWLGSAAAWCVIALLHSLGPKPRATLEADVPRPSLEMIMVLQNPDSGAVAELKPAWKNRAFGPRSERCLEEANS